MFKSSSEHLEDVVARIDTSFVFLNTFFCRQRIFDFSHLSLVISRPTELTEIREVQFRRFSHTTPANGDLWCRPLRTGNFTRRVGEAAFNLWRRSLSRPSLPSTSTRLCCEGSPCVQGMWAVFSALSAGRLSALIGLEAFDLDS